MGSLRVAGHGNHRLCFFHDDIDGDNGDKDELMYRDGG